MGMAIQVGHALRKGQAEPILRRANHSRGKRSIGPIAWRADWPCLWPDGEAKDTDVRARRTRGQADQLLHWQTADRGHSQTSKSRHSQFDPSHA